MNDIRRTLAVLITIVSLAGCASTGPMAESQRAAIKRVSIAPVEVPPTPFILSDNVGGAFLLGGVAGVGLASAVSDAPGELRKTMIRGGTDIAALLRGDLGRQLQARGFEVLPEGDARADAVVVTRIVEYGLSGHMLSKPPVRHAHLNMRVHIKRASDGTTIWSHLTGAGLYERFFSRLQARPTAEFLADPALLDGEFRKVSDMLAQDVASKL